MLEAPEGPGQPRVDSRRCYRVRRRGLLAAAAVVVEQLRLAELVVVQAQVARPRWRRGTCRALSRRPFRRR